MRITIVTPAVTGSLAGNRITAKRWSGIFRALGHRVSIETEVPDRTELLVALHAKKSSGQILKFASSYPERKLVVALSGTDIYGDLLGSRAGMAALDVATALVALEPSALERLPKRLQPKSQVIRQSAPRPESKPKSLSSCFEVSISGHLRKEKDPFAVPNAIRLLPDHSKIRVTHIGRALKADMKKEAESHAASNSRYRWLGEKKHWEAKRLVARSRLFVNSSLIESSSNAVVEALVAGVPILASKIPGNIGVFGKSYAGYFQAGDYRKLARLLERAESDRGFHKDLKQQCRETAKQFTPSHEKNAWNRLISNI